MSWLKRALLVLCLLVMLLAFAAAVPSGRITDEALERYEEELEDSDEGFDFL